MIMRTYIVR